jgi:hypothetical protein
VPNQDSLKRVVVLLLLAAGCGRYWVAERTLDAYAVAPRAERKRAVVPAERVSDGKATFVRASEARLLPTTDGRGRRQVRVLRPMTVAGLVFLGASVAWAAVAGSAFAIPNEQPCQSEPCNLGKATLFGVAMGEASVAFLVGGIMSLTGATTLEARPR